MVRLFQSKNIILTLIFIHGCNLFIIQGEKKTTLGEFTEMQTGVNTSALHIRGGSIITIQETYKTAIGSRHTFVDIIIALDSNFTANGDFFVDDSTRRSMYHEAEFKI